MSLDTLRADASGVLANLDGCWSPSAAIQYLAGVLVRLHRIERDMAVAAAEQAVEAGWPR
jgi:hypothetical protein